MGQIFQAAPLLRERSAAKLAFEHGRKVLLIRCELHPKYKDFMKVNFIYQSGNPLFYLSSVPTMAFHQLENVENKSSKGGCPFGFDALPQDRYTKEEDLLTA